MLSVVLTLIALYVGHVFLMRYLDLKMCKNWGRDPEMINMSPTPMFWFIPIIGTLFISLLFFASWYKNWSETANGKWFLRGNKNFDDGN